MGTTIFIEVLTDRYWMRLKIFNNTRFIHGSICTRISFFPQKKTKSKKQWSTVYKNQRRN